MARFNLLKPALVCIIIGGLISCQKVELQKPASNRPILQSFLIPGQKIKLQVYKELVFGKDDSLEKINKLNISLSTSNESETLTFNGSGQYSSEHLLASPGKTYTVSFQYNGKTITASTSIPSKPSGFSISPAKLTVSASSASNLKLNWNNKEGDYYYVSINSLEDIPIASDTQKGNKTTESLVTQGQTDEIKMKSFAYLGRHEIILYHILPDYAVYYKEYSINSNYVKQPPSNISNGLGIFSGLNADTLMIQVVE